MNIYLLDRNEDITDCWRLYFADAPDVSVCARYALSATTAHSEYGELPKPDFSDIARIDDRGIQLLLRCIGSSRREKSTRFQTRTHDRRKNGVQ